MQGLLAPNICCTTVAHKVDFGENVNFIFGQVVLISHHTSRCHSQPRWASQNNQTHYHH
jgi:hypothetical protein